MIQLERWRNPEYFRRYGVIVRRVEALEATGEFGVRYAGTDSERNAGLFRSAGADAAPAAVCSSTRPLSLAPRRNAAGVVPVCMRKSVVRWLWHEQPTSSAMSAMLVPSAPRSSIARCTRVAMMYRCGVIPVARLKPRAKRKGSRPTAAAS